MNIKRVIPIVFLIFSILYLFFAFSIEQRRMIGDQQGWDPGSRAIPLGTGFIMIFFSGYLVFSSRKEKEDRNSMDSETKRLVFISTFLPVFYILTFRYIGFILLTSFMLFTLIYFYYEKGIKRENYGRYFTGLIVSTVFTVSIYSIGRFLTRFLVRYGKKASISLFSGRIFTTLATLLVLSFVYFLILFISKTGNRKTKNRIVFISILTASAVTEILYLVFRQIFWVNLAHGLIFW